MVSKEDQDKLAADLTKSLSGKAKDDIKKGLDSDTLVLPVFLKTTFDTKDYSKDVGDETTDVALTASIKFQGATYKQSQLYDFAKNKLDSVDGGDLTVSPGNFSVEVKDAKVKSASAVSATLGIKASLIPKINKDETSKK